MIIDTHGNILQAWFTADGALIADSENEYGIEFHIGVLYNDTQRQQAAEIKTLKKLLKDTDFKAIKYSEGAISEEEYEPVKTVRASWRARINEIEESFVRPTLTRKEIDMAERLAIENLTKEDADGNTDNQTILNA